VGFTLGEGGHDAPELQDAEEAVAAGVAAVGGKAQPALYKDEGAIFNPFAGNVLEIEIAAAGTVRVALEGGSDAPGMEAAVAAVAAPGSQARGSESEVEDSVAVGAKTIVTAAVGADHRRSECVAKDTEKQVGGQDRENT